MTPKEALKEIKDYLQLDLSDYDKNKLLAILNENHKVVVKHIEKPKLMYVQEKPLQLIHELSVTCALYNVPIKSVIGKGKGGDLEVVKAKVHFCRKVKINDKRVKSIQLAHILQKDHSTILHYWYKSKADVPYPPLQKTKICKRSKSTQMEQKPSGRLQENSI